MEKGTDGKMWLTQMYYGDGKVTMEKWVRV